MSTTTHTHDGRSPRRLGRRPGLAKFLGGTAITALVASTLVVSGTAAMADAPQVLATEFSTVGAFSVAVPADVCAVTVTALGGAGGSVVTGVADTNGAGAQISVTYPVAPGQIFTGVVGGGGSPSTGTGLAGSGGPTPGVGGTGIGDGGRGGTVGGGATHAGAGGGGGTSVSADGVDLIFAGGGGASAGGHATDGGFGGDAGLPVVLGAVAAGSNGLDGFNNPGTGTPGGGQGGQASGPGAGGVHTVDASLDGFAGSARAGGNGGTDPNYDSGGGGGGGYTGGGGGASTTSNGSGTPVSAANAGGGGGGGSSYVANATPYGNSGVASGLTSSAGERLPAGHSGTGADGSVTFAWVMCDSGIELTKAADVATYEAGDVITYTFRATNGGEIDLNNVTVTDPLVGLSALTYSTWSGVGAIGNPITLKPGEWVEFTATLTATQDSVDDGVIPNTANAKGITPGGHEETAEASKIVDADGGPKIDLTKTANHTTFNAGDEVTYTFRSTNTGDVTLNGVTITDPMLGGTLPIAADAWPAAIGVLLPGEAVETTATYTATDGNFEDGEIHNVASTSGTPNAKINPQDPNGPKLPQEPVTDTDEVTIVSAAPGLALTKVANAGTFVLGDVITYTFTATNTGDNTLSNVQIVDPLVGLSNLAYDWASTTAVAGSLAAGESVTATAKYTTTQADVDRGFVHNAATAQGVPPGADLEEPPVYSPPAEVTVEGPDSHPSISLVKSGTVAGAGQVGDTVNYTFVATNTGNVTLSAVTINDELKGLSALTYSWLGDARTLAPGESVKATATYVLTDADVKAGKVVNTADVTGVGPRGDNPVGGTTVTDQDAVTVVTGVLAFTGSEIPLMESSAAVLLMLLLGAGLVLVSRKRNQTA